MFERLYKFMDFLHRKIDKYPEEKYFIIEMDIDLYHFCVEIGFIPEDGIFKFEDKTFVLG